MADLLKPKPLTIQLRDYLNLSSPNDLPWEQAFFFLISSYPESSVTVLLCGWFSMSRGHGFNKCIINVHN